MSISIVYRSRMGASYYYAQALRDNLEGKLFFYRSLPQERTDLLIYCAGLENGKISRRERRSCQTYSGRYASLRVYSEHASLP